MNKNRKRINRKLVENKIRVHKRLSESVSDANVMAFITNLGKYNEGELAGKWVSFPIDEDDFEEVLKSIGINDEYEEWFVTDYDGDFSKALYDNLGEYPSYENLQEYGELLEDVSVDDVDTINALIEYAGYNFEDAVDKVQNGEASIDSNVFSDSDIGYYFVDIFGGVENMSKDELESYFDYEAYGRDKRLGGEVIITDYGMLVVD